MEVARADSAQPRELSGPEAGRAVQQDGSM